MIGPKLRRIFIEACSNREARAEFLKESLVHALEEDDMKAMLQAVRYAIEGKAMEKKNAASKNR